MPMLTQVSARARLAVARRPWLGWAAIALVAALAALAAAAPVRDLEAARRQWGETRTVLVATRDGAPGEPVADVAEPAERPVPMIPASAAVDADGTLRTNVAAGEILVAGDVATGDGTPGLVPSGWLGVPVSEAVASGAAIGDRVDVVAQGAVLTTGALVVRAADANGATTVVAVPTADAPAVAAAASDQVVVLLLRP